MTLACKGGYTEKLRKWRQIVRIMSASTCDRVPTSLSRDHLSQLSTEWLQLYINPLCNNWTMLIIFPINQRGLLTAKTNKFSK